ncbi:hypothetical protein VPH35_061503 [Triticum aestivum]
MPQSEACLLAFSVCVVNEYAKTVCVVRKKKALLNLRWLRPPKNLTSCHLLVSKEHKQILFLELSTLTYSIGYYCRRLLELPNNILNGSDECCIFSYLLSMSFCYLPSY